MTIQFQCECGQAMRAADSAVGMPTNCPACGMLHVVPRPLDAADWAELAVGCIKAPFVAAGCLLKLALVGALCYFIYLVIQGAMRH